MSDSYYMIARPISPRQFIYACMKGGTFPTWTEEPHDTGVTIFSSAEATREFTKNNKQNFGPDDQPLPRRYHDGKDCPYCGNENVLRHTGTDRSIPKLTVEFICNHCRTQINYTFSLATVAKIKT